MIFDGMVILNIKNNGSEHTILFRHLIWYESNKSSGHNMRHGQTTAASVDYLRSSDCQNQSFHTRLFTYMHFAPLTRSGFGLHHLFCCLFFGVFPALRNACSWVYTTSSFLRCISKLTQFSCSASASSPPPLTSLTFSRLFFLIGYQLLSVVLYS